MYETKGTIRLGEKEGMNRISLENGIEGSWIYTNTTFGIGKLLKLLGGYSKKIKVKMKVKEHEREIKITVKY